MLSVRACVHTGSSFMGMVVYAHVNIPPPDLRATCADVSDAVADAIHRGLAKSPTDRFPDVRALMAIDQRSRDSFEIDGMRIEGPVSTDRPIASSTHPLPLL